MAILDIAKTCAGRLQLPKPTTFIGSNSNNDIFLLEMIYQAIQEIRDSYPWPELQKEYPFLTINGMDAYRMPQDLNAVLTETLWNRDQRWPLLGPLDPQEWQTYKSGYIAALPQSQYRVKGWNTSQFFINPTPSQTDFCIFEYISRTAIRPKSWAANTAYLANTYVSNDGLILKCTTPGTSHTSESPEFGRDGTVFWKSVPAYVSAISYYVEQYVYANNKIYQCTVSGKGSTAPSHSSGSATTGTATFLYISTPSAWVGGTSYAVGATATINSGSDYVIATVGGISGDYTPKFRSVLQDVNSLLAPTVDTITDGTVVWTVIQSSYETFLADTDEVILDNQMIIDGAVWRFKKERGLPYQQLKQDAEAQLDIITTNLTSSDVVDARFGARARWPWWIGWHSYPIGNYGI